MDSQTWLRTRGDELIVAAAVERPGWVEVSEVGTISSHGPINQQRRAGLRIPAS